MAGSPSVPIEQMVYPNGFHSIRITYVLPLQYHGIHSYKIKRTEEIPLFVIRAWNIQIVQGIDSNNVMYYQFDKAPGELIQTALIFDTCYYIVSAIHLEFTSIKSESSTQIVPKYSRTEVTLLYYNNIEVTRREETVTQLTN